MKRTLGITKLKEKKHVYLNAWVTSYEWKSNFFKNEIKITLQRW